MAQIDGAGQQDTDDQNAETLQAALAQRQVTLQGQPQSGSDVPIHQNSDPVSDESEILRSCQPLTGKRRVPCTPSPTSAHTSRTAHESTSCPCCIRCSTGAATPSTEPTTRRCSVARRATAVFTSAPAMPEPYFAWSRS